MNRNNISATILADSKNEMGDRITTMKVVMPRIVLAEFNTHRMFSRNSASSRAIPTKKMLEMIGDNPFIPIAWQKDHKGMQGTEYMNEEEANIENQEWLNDISYEIESARKRLERGVTKQIINRRLEDAMWHTVIVTATEWVNFFKLRCPQYKMETSYGPQYFRSKKDYLMQVGLPDEPKNYKDWTTVDWLKINNSQAEIHIQAAAEAMWDAMNESTPKELKAGEWHIPFSGDLDNDDFTFFVQESNESDGTWNEPYISKLRAKVAVARCARLSYQTLGDNPVIDFHKDIALHDRLAKMEHWSPFEHIAQAMSETEYARFIKGELECSHDIDCAPAYDAGINYGNVQLGWHRNFKGFIQYRGVIDN